MVWFFGIFGRIGARLVRICQKSIGVGEKVIEIWAILGLIIGKSEGDQKFRPKIQKTKNGEK